MYLGQLNELVVQLVQNEIGRVQIGIFCDVISLFLIFDVGSFSCTFEVISWDPVTE